MNRLGWAGNRMAAAYRYLSDRHRVLSSVRHIAGPKRFDLPPDEVVAICVGNDAAYYLPVFFEWHRRIGIEKFLYIDNNSTDASVEIARAEPDTIVLSCNVSWRLYEKFIRSDITRMHVGSGWCAMIDADELLEYNAHETVPITRFLDHENAKGHTAVIAQMLDMFPDGDLRETDGLSYRDCIRDFRFFDLRNIVRRDYFEVFAGLLRDNTISNPDTRFLFGGIRKTVFGEDCALTKHPLIRIEKSKRPFIFPHYSNGVRCSDRSVLLKHYKFAGDSIARDRFRKAHETTGDAGSLIRTELYDTGQPLNFFSEHALEYRDTRELVARGFLFV